MVTEREWTRGLAEFFGGVRSDVELGIGDDAAIVPCASGRSVIACDPVVGSVHFDDDAEPTAIGRKAVLRNLSDLAAMGARPTFAVVSVLLPAGTSDATRHDLFAGLRSAAADHGCEIVGGDCGATPGPLVVTVTVLGELVGEPLRRDAARVGDALFVSGPLGGSSCGRHLEPTPRFDIAEPLAKGKGVGGVIDVSDGLALDLRTMLDASDVPGAELREDAIPVHADAVAFAARTGRSPLEYAIGDGEDHELLFSLRQGVEPPPAVTGCVRIGTVCADSGMWLVGDRGRRALAPEGFQHDV